MWGDYQELLEQYLPLSEAATQRLRLTAEVFMNPLQQALLLHFGCGSDMTCKLARQLRPRIMEQLLCEVSRPGGEITKIGGITKSRAEWVKALESLLEMTYRICELAAESEGPYALHCHPHVCGEDLACYPRRHYGRRMW